MVRCGARRSMLAWVVVTGIASVASADGDFGTRQEAETLASQVIDIVDRDGIAAAIQAMHDPAYPFVSSRMGVNLFSGSTVVADNREPETIAADYAETTDLTGQLAWPIIAAAARANDDARLRWYHYDTQEAYEYRCYAMSSRDMVTTVMVCR